ncbi:MAG: hypothetical protein ABR577_09590 [Pyrinomonadaceae bacterium]
MKQVFRLSSAASALVFFFGLFTFAGAQTADSVITQITSSATRDSFASDISGDGRYVVIESTGDVATENPQNADGNREIFLYDNVQRRTFQLTNTRSALNDSTRPSTDASNIRVEVDNVRPAISRDGRFIVFGSNAPTPANFNASTLTDAALNALITTDGFNTELFLYEIPAADTKSGGTLTRLTTTRASRVPQAGSATRTPFIADDNRDAAISDDGSIITFASTSNDAANVPGGASNTDGNAEIFVYSNNTKAFTQLTNTRGDFVFNDNPSLSANGSVVAFISNANIAGDNNDDGSGNGNGEIYVANINSANGATAAAPRQITRTRSSATSSIANIFSPGRRLSRDGNLLAFESTAADPTANNGDNQVSAVIFVYNIAARSFAQFGPRAAQGGNEVLRFPTFTDYRAADGTPCNNTNLATCVMPTTLVFASRLSFTSSGDAPPSATDASSLNPNSTTQIFSVPLSQPNASPNPSNRFTRLTNTPSPAVLTIPTLQPFVGDSSQRIAFNLNATELGGGNADNSFEVFYLASRTGTDVSSSATIRFFTALTLQPVTAGAIAPAVNGLAPGEIGVIDLRPTQPVPLNRTTNPSPALEMNGVSVTVNNVAASIYFASENQINFVVPPGLTPTASSSPASVSIFNSNNNTVIRTTLPIVAAQPDIGVTGNGRATVFNVTGGMMATAEPFSVTTNVTNAQGQTTSMATVLGIMLTGVRNVQASQVTVTIGSTTITGASIQAVAPTTPLGFDQINVQVPASLAGMRDQPVIVRVTIGSVTYTSRTDTPPLISFQ